MATYTKAKTHSGHKAVQGKNEIQLPAHDLYRLDHSRGEVDIQAVRGTLWITLPGDPQDYVLRAGDRLPVEKRGRVLVEALTEAGFRVQ
jgi:hypothetical protein